MKLDLNQVTVSVKDVERSIAFYQLLGLKLIVKALPRGRNRKDPPWRLAGRARVVKKWITIDEKTSLRAPKSSILHSYRL